MFLLAQILSGAVALSLVQSPAWGSSVSKVSLSQPVQELFSQLHQPHAKRSKRDGSHNRDTASASPNPTTSSNKDCQERKTPVEQARTSLLQDAELSLAAELCAGMNEHIFTDLLKTSRLPNASNDETAARFLPGREDHAAKEKPRIVKLAAVHFHVGNSTVCLSLENLKDPGLFHFLTSNQSVSLYAQVDKKGSREATVGRIILNSSSDEIATVFLGTSDFWRITGTFSGKSRVLNNQTLILGMGDMVVTLDRHLLNHLVTYIMRIKVDKSEDGSYGGLIGDLLTKQNEAPSSQCVNLDRHQGIMQKFRLSVCTFMNFFLTLLEELSLSLPSIE